MKLVGTRIPGFKVKAGKVVKVHVPRDAAAARRERPGASKKIRVKRKGA